ncbi:MAG: hypothetical protein WA964_07420 [Ilumatobacter sp.]|uniref:hypothetical protein n=1 Tax=Ilumatobacter sp. TaxID=1967498 RepID=UPI003C755952
MTQTATDPIAGHWTTEGLGLTDRPVATRPLATAADVNARLARTEVADLDERLVPYLAAAAAELALITAVPWRFSADDPPVALLRMIAKVTMRHPDVGGPHTARLLDQLS